MGRPVTWFEIGGPAPEELGRFYAELLGWTVEPVEPVDGAPYAIVDTDGRLGGGIAGGAGVVIYAEVEELDAVLARAVELGGRVVTPVTDIPGVVTYARVADPAGNTFGLAQASARQPVKPAPKHVLTYQPSPDALELAPIHFPAHRARLDAFHGRGELLMVGTFADPIADGSLAVFTTRGAAEAFVAGDPFVREGVVSSWAIKEWHEVYVP